MTKDMHAAIKELVEVVFCSRALPWLNNKGNS
jgi:hypothetical protein